MTSPNAKGRAYWAVPEGQNIGVVYRYGYSALLIKRAFQDVLLANSKGVSQLPEMGVLDGFRGPVCLHGPDGEPIIRNKDDRARIKKVRGAILPNENPGCGSRFRADGKDDPEFAGGNANLGGEQRVIPLLLDQLGAEEGGERVRVLDEFMRGILIH